jgi:hypothetical protein
MPFRTKLDFSDNRQIKQRAESTTILSGTTVFGVPYSALTRGPDLSTTAVTNTIYGVTGNFSGNSLTTIFNFSNPSMNIGIGGFVPIIPSNSATTQYTQAFTAKTITTIDGNSVVLAYSGVSYDITPSIFLNLGGGDYSGQVFTEVLKFISAAPLDFTGRTIWVDVSGITRTKQLIVNADAQFTNIGSAAQAGSLHYTSDGTLTVNTSDRRLKTNIVPIENALLKVLSLSGVSYNWMENPNGKKRIGFIAQDVDETVPELTFINENTNEQYMGVHYDNVVALLVEAVKEITNIPSGATSLSGVSINGSSINVQTIIAEDNNIELNYNGNNESSIGGGVRVLHAISGDVSAEIITDNNGDWITNNNFKPNGLVIPFYTPASSNENNGIEGNITHDNQFVYIKTSLGWTRIPLETF